MKKQKIDNKFSELIIKYLIDIANDNFSLTHDDVLNEKNELVQEILFGFIYLAQDLSYNKQEAEKVLNLQKEKAIAQKSAEFKTLFLANMSHEIRTPLNGIIGMVDILLKNNNLRGEYREYVEVIQHSSLDLLSILNDILDLTKLEAGMVDIENEKTDFYDVIESVKALFSASATKKSLDLNVDIADNVPQFIKTDRTRLIQVLSNLVGNAIKFTDKGSINIYISLKDNTEEDTIFKIRVIDTGPGISEDKQKKLFSEFYQIDQSTTKSVKGTGLGLAISKKLISILKGEIGVISREGEGAEFWFTFKAELFENIPVAKSSQAIIKYNEYLRHVLVVDDNFINLKVARLMLLNFGCTVETCSNGKEALDLYKEKKYDLILMDIQMPGIDGIETTQILRKSYMEIPPVIAVSANAMEGDAQKYIGQGLDDYLSKPLTINSLALMLEKWLN